MVKDSTRRHSHSAIFSAMFRLRSNLRGHIITPACQINPRSARFISARPQEAPAS
jgi:hypothetical protein